MKLNKRQKELIGICRDHNETGYGNLVVSGVAAQIGTTPQSVGRMANTLYKKGITIFITPSYNSQGSVLTYIESN